VISATFADTDIINGTMPTVSGGTWEIDEHYHTDEGAGDFDPGESGTIDESVFVVEGPLTLGVRYYPELPDWAFDNGWHNSMILHYAERHQPGGTLDCDINGSGSSDRCIWIRRRAQYTTNNWDKDQIAVLLNTGEHGWVDGNADGDFTDNVDRDSVAEEGNREFNYIIRWRWPGDPDSGTPRKVPPGNDNLLILEELP